MIASNFHYGNYLLLFFLWLNCHTFIGLCMTYDVYLFPSGDIRQYGQRFACSSWHFNKRLKLNSNNIYHCKWTKMQQRISKSLWNVRMIIKKIWFCIIGQDVKLFFPRSAFFIIAILDGDCKKGAETRVWFSWTGLSFTWISVNHFWWMNISLNSPRENKTLIRFDTDIRIHVHRVDQLQICWLHSCGVTIIYLEIIACIVIRVILICK